MKKIISLIILIVVLFSLPVSGVEKSYNVPQPYYLSFTGTVEEINNSDDKITKIYLKGEDEQEAYIILNEDTYYADNVKIEKNTKITGYYEAGRPMIMIYPPHYTIDIVTPVYDKDFVKADRFDSNLLSKDKQLKLNISDDTEIIWENNTQIYWFAKPTIKELESAVSNRNLIVYYDFTTKSIPAQTTPKKIIVLTQQFGDKINIIVDNNVIEAPKAYVSDEGNIMVPVRAISEALGYKVIWNNDERSVLIGDDISFKVNDASYYLAKTAITLEEASVIVNDRTFVPLSFFKEVIKTEKANFLDDSIIINSCFPQAE